MNTNQTTSKPPALTGCQATNPNTAQQQKVLAEKEQQADYEKAYLAQLRQQQCPGCGEADIF